MRKESFFVGQELWFNDNYMQPYCNKFSDTVSKVGRIYVTLECNHQIRIEDGKWVKGNLTHQGRWYFSQNDMDEDIIDNVISMADYKERHRRI